MCDEATWTKADHKTLHDALEAYADEIRDLHGEQIAAATWMRSMESQNQQIAQKTLQFRGQRYTVTRVNEGQRDGEPTKAEKQRTALESVVAISMESPDDIGRDEVEHLAKTVFGCPED